MHASDADKTSASDTASEYVDDSDESKESRPGLAPSPSGSANISDVDSDNADNAEGVDRGICRRVRRMRQSDSFKRVGENLNFESKLLGTITSWSGNVSSSCHLPTRCLAPASKVWGSDEVLEYWLLRAIAETGDVAVGREEHVQRITVAAARARLNR